MSDPTRAFKQLPYSESGKISGFKIEKDHISISVDYDSGGSQNGSFPIDDKLKQLFKVGNKVKALFDSPDPWRGRHIKGLANNHGQEFIIHPKWYKEYQLKIRKEFEEQQKKYHEKMMAIPIYRYESKYQFPDDIDIHGNTKEDGQGFRNSVHLSVSRGMEFMEGKNLDDFSQREYENIKGISEDNKNVEQLKDHINKCVMKELGSNWGHSGMSMILAVQHVFKAKELGWDKYIEWIRSWPSKKEKENSK